MGKKIIIPQSISRGSVQGYFSYRSLYGWDKIVTPGSEFFAYEDLRRMWDSLNVTHCNKDKNPNAMICNH